MIKVMMMIKTHVKLHEHNHPEQKLTIMDPNPPWLKEGYQRNHGSCSEQFATSFATMMSTHCAHNAPPTQASNGLCPDEGPASAHDIGPFRREMCSSDWHQCPLHRPDAKSLVIANSVLLSASSACISGVRAAMPDKRVAWSRLLLGFFERRQKAGARLWLMSPSFLPNHRAPNSLFSCAQAPILMCSGTYSHVPKSQLCPGLPFAFCTCFSVVPTGWFFSLVPPLKFPSIEKLIYARLGVSRTIYVNVDSPNLGFPQRWKKREI